MVFRLVFQSTQRASSSLLFQANANGGKQMMMNCFIRNYSKHSLNKNLTLISVDEFVDGKPYKSFKDETKPVVVLLTWLLARDKHVAKYREIYLKNGYNVMSVSVTPWQFFWPVTGVQVVAQQVLNFMETVKDRPLIIHGFSIGAYLWGEALVTVNSDLPRYKPLIESIKGQIWDSAADITETSKGVPLAMFPKNDFLRSAMMKYVNYHLSSFYDVATQHYLRASQLYHTTPVRAPALIFVSENDVIGTVTANSKVREYWESVGMKVVWKCWQKSRHVSHLMYHKDEYLSTLHAFLADIQSNEDVQPKKLKAKN